MRMQENAIKRKRNSQNDDECVLACSGSVVNLKRIKKNNFWFFVC